MAHWSYGPLVLWPIGPTAHCMILQFDPLALRLISPVVYWSYGPLVLWPIGPTVHWSYSLAHCSYSSLALWLTGPMVH